MQSLQTERSQRLNIEFNTRTARGGVMITQIGFLRHNDVFEFEGRKYKVRHVIDGTNGYVSCVDIETHKVTRIHIDSNVEVK